MRRFASHVFVPACPSLSLPLPGAQGDWRGAWWGSGHLASAELF